MKKILIIEDDLSLSQGIELALKDDQYTFLKAHLLSEAQNYLSQETIDLAILDINLPDGNGLDLLTRIREKWDFPVLILTALDMEVDIVTGLEMGADDYITKPFSLMVLRARVHAALRKQGGHTKRSLKLGVFQFDFEKMRFTKQGVMIELSKTEQKLLRLLVMNRGNTLLRSELVDKVWTDGAEYVDENALSVTIKRLRDKLEDDPSKPEYIKTVYGKGYTWQAI